MSKEHPEQGQLALSNLDDHDDEGPSFIELATVLASRWPLLIAAPLICSAIAIGVSFAMKPSYTASTTFLPPQQQSAAASALASLGPLAGLAGAAAGIKSPADQFVSLLESKNVSDAIIEEFKLQSVYELKLHSEVRQELAERVRISLGKKDGLISVSVDDELAQRAADMANAYVKQLRRLTGELNLTEAQQRRAFFDQQLQQTRERLSQAQNALKKSGFNGGALNAEPKAAAEAYARLKAEETSSLVRLQTLRAVHSDQSVEVKQALASLAALQQQLNTLAGQRPSNNEAENDYISKYRDFKYQENLFELFSRQYELAKVDESREGAVIQVVDAASPPDRRTKPKRLRLGLTFGAIGFALTCAGILTLDGQRRRRNDPESELRWKAFIHAFKR